MSEVLPVALVKIAPVCPTCFWHLPSPPTITIERAPFAVYPIRCANPACNTVVASRWYREDREPLL